MKNLKLVTREANTKTIVHVDGVAVGRDLVVIAGPCSVESEEQTLKTAHAVMASGAAVYQTMPIDRHTVTKRLR